MKHVIFAFTSFLCTVINIAGWILNYKMGGYGLATLNACLAGCCFVNMLWTIKEALDD